MTNLLELLGIVEGDVEIEGQPKGSFRGSTYVPELDFDRLSNNLQRVYATLKDGAWHTAEELRSVGGTEATRRVRDLRGDVWGPLRIESRRVDDMGGLWEYRLDLNTWTPHIHEKLITGTPNREAQAAEDALKARRTKALRAVRAATDTELGMIEPIIEGWLGDDALWADLEDPDKV